MTRPHELVIGPPSLRPPCRSRSTSDGWRRTPSGVLSRSDRGRSGVDQPPDWICPLLAIEWWHAEVRGDLRRRATSHDISNVLSTAPHRFNSRKPNGDVDAHPWCEGFHAAMRPRLLAWRRCSTWATSVTACFCPSWCTVSMIRDTPAWTGHDGPRDRGLSAQRLHGYFSGRRRHRQYWMPTRYARAG